jgi:Leu/Phe-tRNA-protein transferase
MAADIGPVAGIHFQFLIGHPLIGHPWLEAVLVGGLVGLVGASFYIGASSLTRVISKRRRSREALTMIVRFNETQPTEDFDLIPQRESEVAESRGQHRSRQ